MIDNSNMQWSDMTKSFLFFLTLISGIAALHSLAPGRIVHVASYPTLLSACQNALPGDTIIIASGTYTITGVSRIMITSRPGPVLVKGITGNPNDVIVQGQGQDNANVQMIFNLDYSSQWTFQDLTVRNSYYHGFKFDHNSTDCVLRNIIMRDHGESGVKGTSDPPSGLYPDRLLIDKCDIGFTGPTGGTRSVVEGIDGVGVNDWIIRRSKFVNIQKNGNPAYAIFTKGNSSNTIIEQNIFYNCFIGASFGGGGTAPQYFRDNDTQYEHRNGIIRNNVIIRTSDAGIYINKGKNCKISNNTVFECILTIQLRFVESSGWVRNNLVKPSPNNPNEPIIRLRDGATLLANEANLSASNSYFVMPTGNDNQLDLHLKAGTAPVDGGVNVNPDVTNDYDGFARPAGGAYDVGAYEYGAIPIELLTFTVERIGTTAHLRWQTATETNNAGFEIERSQSDENDLNTSSSQWEQIGFVSGHGTSTYINHYSFIDPNPARDQTKKIFYRLKQIDYDGAHEYSFVVMLAPVLKSGTFHLYQNFPNPFTTSTRIQFSIPDHVRKQPISLIIFDMNGREMRNVFIDWRSRSSEIEIDADGLAPGKYFYTLRTTIGSVHREMILIR